MSEKDINCGRSIAEIAETLPEKERAILLAYGEGIAAASALHRPHIAQSISVDAKKGA